jgi:polysaccharide export outer membrane protein
MNMSVKTRVLFMRHKGQSHKCYEWIFSDWAKKEKSRIASFVENVFDWLSFSLSAWVRRIVTAVSLIAGLAGCVASLPPQTVNVAMNSAVKIQQSAVTDSETKRLTAQEINRALNGAIGGSYVLGPNDLLGVTVYQHPELSVPSSSDSGIPGALITGDGTVSLPLVGEVQLGGLTIGQAQNLLEGTFAQYVKGARVNVQLIKAESLRYYLLGAFASPGIKYPEQTMSLLDALALGGSVDMEKADLYQAYVTHGGVKLPIDLHALLVEGDMSQDLVLANGDAVVVPTAADEAAYVFGAVGRPGAVPFQGGALSLLQAIGAAGMDLSSYTDARFSDVRVIRAQGASATFMVVDAQKILSGEAAPLSLQPGDIVFVPPTAVATWNQVLAQLLPSLQTIATGLQPFVTIRYLQTH